MKFSIFRTSVATLGAVALLAVTSQRASAQCPAAGDVAAGCNILFTIGSTGLITTGGLGGNYDGAEDVLVGVVNNWTGHTVIGLGLSGTGIFGFDGDGVCSSVLGWPNFGGTYGRPSGCGSLNDYAGPNTSFTVTNLNTGFVNFLGGGLLGNGGSAWFSLEEPPAAGAITAGQILEVTPEPATMSLMAMGLVGMAGAVRRRKNRK